jgi:proline dehydrogenase
MNLPILGVVHLAEQRSIIERLVFRFVKKHIAGPASASALDAVRDINAKGLSATLTLLNDSVSNTAKARYNVNAYVQLIRQISRLNLDAAVSLRPVQVGCEVDRDLTRKNLEEIASSASEGKVTLWIEREGTSGIQDQFSLYRALRDRYGNVGIEIRPESEEAVRELNGSIEPDDMVKVRYYLGGTGKKMRKSTVGVYSDYIDRLLSKRAEVSVWEHDFDVIKKLATSKPNYKKKVSFEIPLGYSAKGLKRLQQCKLDLSVYVPFGKDWVPYLESRLAEGKKGRIAVALLDGKDDEHGNEG